MIIKVQAKPAYNIILERDIFNKVGNILRSMFEGFHTVIVTDENVFKFYGKKLEYMLKSEGFIIHTFIIKSGESSKNFSNVIDVYSFLSNCNVTKKSLLIAFGGGVVGDITGFISATFLRGIQLIHIPTTLLAQIDSSIGGKNAINTEFGKNLIGTFKNPALVLTDPGLLKTLDEKDFINGFAEVIKYAVAFSEDFFKDISMMNYSEITDIQLENLILHCIKIKKKLVQIDAYDKNERLKLNFGHTIGHAVEHLSNNISHGQAVAVGMSVIMEKCEKLKITRSGETNRVKQLLYKFRLPISTNIPIGKILDCCVHDKKFYGNILKMVVVPRIGYCNICRISLNQFYKLLSL